MLRVRESSWKRIVIALLLFGTAFGYLEASVVSFTPQERRSIADVAADNRDRLIAVLWSAKESALKALTLGLRADTRSVEVQLAGQWSDEWQPLRAGEFDGWWRVSELIVRTMVAAPAPSPPVTLVREGEGRVPYEHAPCS